MVWGSFLIAAAALKHPLEMVITPKATTSLLIVTHAGVPFPVSESNPKEVGESEALGDLRSLSKANLPIAVH